MNHAQAADIVRRAWTSVWGAPPSENARRLVQAVALLESGYGRAPGQHARWAATGRYTWGNLETAPLPDGSCRAGWDRGTDAGSPRCFRLHDNDHDAARAMIVNLTKDHPARAEKIRAALETGDAEVMAEAMRSPPGYFEAPAHGYAIGLDEGLRVIDRAVPRGSAPTVPGAAMPGTPAPSGSVPLTIAALSMVAASVLFVGVVLAGKPR